jgi:hypothetical protein
MRLILLAVQLLSSLCNKSSALPAGTHPAKLSSLSVNQAVTADMLLEQQLLFQRHIQCHVT